jgi:hypothetical protein
VHSCAHTTLHVNLNMKNAPQDGKMLYSSSSFRRRGMHLRSKFVYSSLNWTTPNDTDHSALQSVNIANIRFSTRTRVTQHAIAGHERLQAQDCAQSMKGAWSHLRRAGLSGTLRSAKRGAYQFASGAVAKWANPTWDEHRTLPPSTPPAPSV